jgi:hypothetical protein
MKKLLVFLLFPLLACAPEPAPTISATAASAMVEDPIAARIARIENSLQPSFRIAGETVPHYNI